MRDFQVSVFKVLHTGQVETFACVGELDGLFVTSSRVAPTTPIEAVGRLEAVGMGVMVAITASADWSGECVRCLREVGGKLEGDSRELFQEGETTEEIYGYRGDVIDLSELVRDLVILSLPPAPLCIVDCLGLCRHCGSDLNEGPCGCDLEVVDPRWAALDLLDPGQVER
ncbi:MAG: YceD family protein [Ferrimicrobium sp.]